MKWSEDFATGLRSIDEQHKTLFRISDDYREALDEGRGEKVYDVLLDSLQAYVRAHFSAEEACMALYNCPAAGANSVAHAKFTTVLVRFQEHYSAHGFDPAEARRLVDTLDRWLSDHIGRLDVKLRPLVEGAAVE